MRHVRLVRDSGGCIFRGPHRTRGGVHITVTAFDESSGTHQTVDIGLVETRRLHDLEDLSGLGAAETRAVAGGSVLRPILSPARARHGVTTLRVAAHTSMRLRLSVGEHSGCHAFKVSASTVYRPDERASEITLPLCRDPCAAVLQHHV